MDGFSKEDREAMLNRKMEEIRLKNERLQKRHEVGSQLIFIVTLSVVYCAVFTYNGITVMRSCILFSVIIYLKNKFWCCLLSNFNTS